jgi:hypothetical protein
MARYTRLSDQALIAACCEAKCVGDCQVAGVVADGSQASHHQVPQSDGGGGRPGDGINTPGTTPRARPSHRHTPHPTPHAPHPTPQHGVPMIPHTRFPEETFYRVLLFIPVLLTIFHDKSRILCSMMCLAQYVPQYQEFLLHFLYLL